MAFLLNSLFAFIEPIAEPPEQPRQFQVRVYFHSYYFAVSLTFNISVSITLNLSYLS